MATTNRQQNCLFCPFVGGWQWTRHYSCPIACIACSSLIHHTVCLLLLLYTRIPKAQLSSFPHIPIVFCSTSPYSSSSSFSTFACSDRVGCRINKHSQTSINIAYSMHLFLFADSRNLPILRTVSGTSCRWAGRRRSTVSSGGTTSIISTVSVQGMRDLFLCSYLFTHSMGETNCRCRIHATGGPAPGMEGDPGGNAEGLFGVGPGLTRGQTRDLGCETEETVAGTGRVQCAQCIGRQQKQP